MPRRYFRLTDDVYIQGRWELGNPVDFQDREVDPWQFVTGRSLRIRRRLKLPLIRSGNPLDFSLASFSIPIVRVQIATLFTELAPGDVQLIPVDIESQPEQFSILNVPRVIRCIDEKASGEVKRWAPEHGQPWRVGEYRAVHDLRIDPTKVGDARVFRTWGWTVALIVSEDIKEAMERMGATGALFKEV